MLKAEMDPANGCRSSE